MNKPGEFSSEVSLHSGPAGLVLVVDDEESVRRFAARVLEREGFAVTEARDGAEALDLIRTSLTSFEVVVSDIVMPRLNGVELMNALATSHPDLPVILMSGYASAALADLGITPPCSMLAKPFTHERLLEEVRRCMRGTSTEPRSPQARPA